MVKKIFVVLMVVAFGFGSAEFSNAGTEIVEPRTAPAPTYNYAPPPPRPVYYVPPPPVVVYPRVRFFGPRFGVFRAHRFYVRHGWHPHHHWR
jgi:hypothetical protein